MDGGAACPRRKRVVLSLLRPDDLDGPAVIEVVAERDPRRDSILRLHFGDGTDKYFTVPRGSGDHELHLEHRFRRIPNVGSLENETVVFKWPVRAFMDGYDVEGNVIDVKQTRSRIDGDKQDQEEEPFRLPPEFFDENPL